MTTPTKIKASALGLGALLILVAAILIAFRGTRGDRAAPAAPADAKDAIREYLARQTKQKEFKPAFDFELPARVATLRSNAHALEQRAQAIRAAIRRAEEAEAPVEREFEAIRAEVQKLKQATGAAKTRRREAEARPQPDRNEIAALQAECDQNERAWVAKRAELEAKDAQLKALRDARAPFGQQFGEVEKELQAVRKDLGKKEDELSAQENTFIRAARKQAGEVGSYEELYELIGQQLTAAERLLADNDVERQRIGINLAREACRHALHDAESPWLAARIGEAYLWPHLDRADYSAGTKERAQDILQLCAAAFTALGETAGLARNFELMIAHAPNRPQADAARLSLADLLEQRGEHGRAIQFLKEIQDATLRPQAEQRLARLQAR
jgi:hypothetical protein